MVIAQAIREAYPVAAQGIYEIAATETGLKSSIADEFKKVRNALGISQEELAERLGISRGLVSLIELGKRQADEELLKKLWSLVN